MRTKILACLIITLLLTTAAFADTKVGNGGDHWAREFVKTGWKILNNLKNNYPTSMPKIDLEVFKAKLRSTKVNSTFDSLKDYDGNPVDLINFVVKGKNKILFNRTAWDAMTLEQKSNFIFHEYLGLMNCDFNYDISVFMDSDLGKKEKRGKGKTRDGGSKLY